MEEMLDTYTRDGKYLGIKTRSECHEPNPGFYHKPAWTWIYNDKNEILVQKRSMAKRKYPGYWDMPCAGHVEAGESTVNGVIREAKEEIGVDIAEKDCEFVFEFIEDSAWEIGQVFFVKINKNVDEFALQEEEVDSVSWLNFDDFKELLYSDKWIDYDKKYKDMVVEKFAELFKSRQSS
ncbi:MAG: NUDIX domain-containing protein [Candidatus Saccharibacteria bacterium]|nr:NUDIX domain-containing protein [Candidatus Saccharibacteria bacterium]